MKTNKTSLIIKRILVILFGFVMIYPLLWMIGSSFKELDEIFANAATIFPTKFTTQNYINGWRGFAGYSFGVFYRNSLLVSTIATLGTILSSPFVAFGFARLEFKGRKIWFSIMLMTIMLPYQIIMIPQYILYNNVNLVGTIWPVILPYFFGQAYFIFMFVQFIYGVPRELDDAARIDGCSIYGVYWKIILPLLKAPMVTAVILSFMWKWDDFLGSLLYLDKPELYTVPLALKLFADPTSGSDWGAILAMSTLSIIPIFILFLAGQDEIVEGISAEGLKG